MSVQLDLATFNPVLAPATYYVYGVLDADVPTWDSVEDSSAGILAAIAALPRAYYSRPRLALPPGYAFRLTSTVDIRKCVDLDGQGCVLVPDNAVDAVNVEVDFLHGDTDARVHANCTHIRNLTIRPRNSSGTQTGTALRIRAACCAISHVRIYGFALGFHVHSIGTGDTQYNADYGKIWDLLIRNCTADAAYTQGVDSQQWVIGGMTVLGGKGLHESSFLGNLYLGLSFEGCDGHSLKHDGANNCSTYVHTYLESSDPAQTYTDNGNPMSSPLCLDLGGNAISRLPVTNQRVGFNSSGLICRPPTDVRGSSWDEMYIGRSLTHPLFFQRKGTGGESYGWRLQYIAAGDGKPHRWAIRSERTSADANTPLSWIADTAGSAPNPTGNFYHGAAAVAGGDYISPGNIDSSLDSFERTSPLRGNPDYALVTFGDLKQLIQSLRDNT